MSPLARFVRWLGAAVLLFCAVHVAFGQPDPDECANPRTAADSLFVHQRTGSYAPAEAAKCFDLPEGMQGARTAVQLKQVLDARGLWVPVSELSVDPNYTDEEGRHRIVPMPDKFPQLVLSRADNGDWQYSADTLRQVPELYAQTFSPLSQWFQERLPATFYKRLFGLHMWQYTYAVLLMVLAWLIGRLANILLRSQITRAVERLGIKLDEATALAIQAPLSVAITASIVLWGISDLQLPIQASTVVYQLVTVVLSFAVVLFASRLVNLGAKVAADYAAGTESRLDDQAIPLLRQAGQIIVWTLGVLFVLQNNGVDVWSLVAGLGIGGLAVALAAQDTLANVFGSVTIFIDKPFQVGDWVKVGDVEGTVEEVGFRSTRIRTFYNSLVTIPNSKFNSTNVDNMGARHRRRVKMVLGLTYDTPPEKVQAYVEGVRAILATHPYVERTYEVHFYNLGGSALEILVYYHLKVPGWTEELESRAQNLQEFMRLADELGVSFAFPSTSVYIESTPERPLPPHEAGDIAALEASAAKFAPGGELARPGGVPFSKSWSVKGRTERGSAE
ncbi:MAG: mechanosensitive ion channel family protein [Deltaproteobacteria bacterium]|nr:MAG: mechanosensitive ion channel family protein [Deltaproteobacteria bacterium]